MVLGKVKYGGGDGISAEEKRVDGKSREEDTETGRDDGLGNPRIWFFESTLTSRPTLR